MSKNDKFYANAWLLGGIVAFIGGVSGFGYSLYFNVSFWSNTLTFFYCAGTSICFGIGLFKTVRANKNEVRFQNRKLIDAQTILRQNRALLPTDSRSFNEGGTFLQFLDELGKY